MSYLSECLVGEEEEVMVDMMESTFLPSSSKDPLMDISEEATESASESVGKDPLALPDVEKVQTIKKKKQVMVMEQKPEIIELKQVQPKVHFREYERTKFMAEMDKNIEGIISESVCLFAKDPREYHPFYLRVFNHVTTGQKQGHISYRSEEVLRIWKKYDNLAVERWKAAKENPQPLPKTVEISPYAMYIQTNKVYINGKLITEKRDEERSDKLLKELELKAKNLLSLHECTHGVSSACENIKENLALRLKFFKECCTVNHPADCIKINSLWTKFFERFGNLSGSVTNSTKPTTKTLRPVLIRVQVRPPSPQMALEHYPIIDDSASLKDEPQSPSHDTNDDAPTPIKKKKTIKQGQISSKSKKIVSVNKSKIVSVKKRKAKVSKPLKRGRLPKMVIKAELKVQKGKQKKMALKRYWTTMARKRLKLILKRPTTFGKAVEQEEHLPKLEKKISTLSKKVKRQNRYITIAPKSTFEVPENLGTDFSTCDQCGQTYRTEHLDLHKEAVHNPLNIENPCPICSRFSKTGRSLWPHFLSVHMPDHLNPNKIAQEVIGVMLDKDMLPKPDDNPSSSESNLWKCSNCYKRNFPSKALLDSHLCEEHGIGREPKGPCPDCGKRKWKGTARLTEHVEKMHKGVENRCEVCLMAFPNAGKLWMHKADSHGIVSDDVPTNWGSVQCEYCGEAGLQGNEYLNHIKFVHPDMVEVVMQERGKSWIKRRRQPVKRGKPRECPKCGLIVKQQLARHLIFYHGMGEPGLKVFYCPKSDCNKPFKQRRTLCAHVTSFHDPVSETITHKKLLKEVEGSSKMFQCTTCEWKMSTRLECILHIVLGHPHFFVNEEMGSDFVKCPHCEEIGLNQDQIRGHVGMFHPKLGWRCPHPECRRIILSPEDLQEHFSKDHQPGSVVNKPKVRRKWTAKSVQIQVNRKNIANSQKVDSAKKNASQKLRKKYTRLKKQDGRKNMQKKREIKKPTTPAKQQRSRSGRILKRKRAYSETSSENSEDEDFTLDQSPPLQKTRQTRSRAVKAVDSKEAIYNHPSIRKIGIKHCTVRVQRLTARQIEMYTKVM